MRGQGVLRSSRRYEFVTTEKAGGVTYTPKVLADFVARQITLRADLIAGRSPVRVLDPAVGQGELLVSLLSQLPDHQAVEVYGFDTNFEALRDTEARLRSTFPNASIHLEGGDFLSFVLAMSGGGLTGGLFEEEAPETYDLIIANPPYVRTQIIGATQARCLAQEFGLKGRVDLYYAFILGMAKVLRPHGVAGIIVSNRFMTTKAGESVRQAIRNNFNLYQVWDLGDTKLFNAAVLPAVLLAAGRNGKSRRKVSFTSIYETQEPAEWSTETPIEGLDKDGVIQITDGRRFRVQRGVLDTSGLSGVWRIATEKSNAWLATVETHTWRTFGQIGKIRVGVKTCADNVFIRKDWDKFPEHQRPELLRPLVTHHIARRFRAESSREQRQILYPHESVDGKRGVVVLDHYPRSKAYLCQHRQTLEGRRYVLEAGRMWYEVWVPQDPAVWGKTKLVFRDIVERPCFWIDQECSVVNGDCYWMICEQEEDESLLWMALAVGNSTFIESFYDYKFNNKLYAGRRRFMTQYTEKFPLPDPKTDEGKLIVDQAKALYHAVGTAAAERMETNLDQLVWRAFGLVKKSFGRGI